MIRRQGDLGGEWDRMRLGENEAEDDLWRARDRTTFSRKKRAALKKKMEGAREKAIWLSTTRKDIQHSKTQKRKPCFRVARTT